MQILFKNGIQVENPELVFLNHTGYGIFETFVACTSQAGSYLIAGYDLHCKRLKEGADKLGLRCPEYKDIKQAVLAVLNKIDWDKINKLKIRIIVYPQEWFIKSEPYTEVAASIKLLPVQMERSFPEIKSCSSLVSVQSKNMAQAVGFDEALLIDSCGIIRETSWGNFFWFDQEGSLCTTDTKILKGVTREIILSLSKENFNLKFCEKVFSDMLSYEECFITRSTSGITAVSQVGQEKIRTGSKIRLLNQLYTDYLFSRNVIL